MARLLTDRYHDRLAGVLSCYDRIVITGTLPGACFAEGMTRILNARGIRVFDYPTQFAAPLRDRVREAAARLAAAAGITIEHIAKSYIRKEDVVAKVLAARGSQPGLVHVISAMAACDSYQPWHDKRTHRNFLRPDSGKCLHYYFYFMDAEFGLIYLRVPTWCPFRLQFYCNGHSWLACQLSAAGLDFAMADNAFVRIADWQHAQTLADALSPKALHRVLDGYAAQCCPVLDVIGQSYHWSLMQVEYSTDLVFRSQAMLAPLYEQLARQAVLAVKAEHVATFLGHKITPQLAQEIGSRFATRIEGTCIKHRFGKSAIKMYDKFTLVLRLETTTNDVSSFKHHRKVEHRKGPDAPWPRSKRPSTACPTFARSFLAPIVVSSGSSPPSTISRQAPERSISLPHRALWPARSSKASISSIPSNNGCCAFFNGPRSISPAFAAPTFSLSSTSSLPPQYRASSPACAPSA